MAQISKRDLILAKASELFMQEGYRTVSMDDIARAVPVSKPTLYNHFKDKKSLFAAVVTGRCQLLVEDIKANIHDEDTVKEVLTSIAGRFLRMLLSEGALRMHRIVAAECEEFPDMAKLFYESGPKQMRNLLADYLAGQHKAGTINAPNPVLSAGMFLSMVKGYNHLECLFGLKKKVSEKQIDEIIIYAVEKFLKGHGG